MLVLSRKVDERIRIKTPHGEMWVVLTRTSEGKARLGFSGPSDFKVLREEHVPLEERPRRGEG